MTTVDHKKPRKALRIVVILIAILGFLMLTCTGVLLYSYFTPKSPRTIPFTLNITATSDEATSTAAITKLSSRAFDPEVFRKQVTSYYPTFQDALDAFHPKDLGKITLLSDALITYDNKDIMLNYYLIDNGAGSIGLAPYISMKANGQYSNIILCPFIMVEPDTLLTGRYNYSLSEKVAYGLAFQIMDVDVASYANNGVPTHIGISDRSDIVGLRILGKAPTRIIKYQSGGKTYYIWIYEGLDIYQHLRNSKDFKTGSFTLGQLMDTLDLHIASTSDPLSKSVPITTAP